MNYKQTQYGKRKRQLQNKLYGDEQKRERNSFQAISSYLRGDESPSPSSERTESIKKEERTRLEAYINEHNLWYQEAISEEDYIGEGAEQRVYKADANHIIKLNNLSFYLSWQDYFDSLVLHNHFFESTAYSLEGFVEQDGKLFAVVKQPFVKAEPVSPDKVTAFLTHNGFTKIKNRVADYVHEDLGLILEDLHDENVVGVNGVPFFIDTVFYTTPTFFEKSKPSYGNPTLRSIEELNDAFNDQLERQERDGLPKGYVYELGNTNGILQSVGIDNLQIKATDTKINDKKLQAEHPFSLSLLRDLPQKLQNPIAVFQSTSKKYEEKYNKVILTDIVNEKGENFIVVLPGKELTDKWEDNDVFLISVYPKSNVSGMLKWITQGLLLYADKIRLGQLLNSQQSNTDDRVKQLTQDVHLFGRSNENSTANVQNNSETTKRKRKSKKGAIIHYICI